MPLSTPGSRGESSTVHVAFVADDEVSPVVDRMQRKLSGSLGGSAFAGGFLGGIAGTALFNTVVSGLGMIKDEYNEIVDLAKESPELFTAEQLYNLEEADKSVQMIKQSFTELKAELASGIAPTVKQVADHFLDVAKASELAAAEGKKLSSPYMTQAEKDAFLELAAAQREAEQATMSWADEQKKATDASKEMKAALKAQTAEYKAILSNMFSIQKQSESFAEGEISRAAEIEEIQQRKIKLALEMNAANVAGELTMKKRQEFAVKQIELDNRLNEIQKEGVDAIQKQEDARQRMVYNMLEQRAAQDGIISSEEVRFLQDTAVGFGLVDRSSADAAIAAADLAESMWDNFDSFRSVQDPMKQTRDLMADIRSLGGVVNFGVNFQTFGNITQPSQSQITNARSFDRSLLNYDFLAQEVTKAQTK